MPRPQAKPSYVPGEQPNAARDKISASDHPVAPPVAARGRQGGGPKWEDTHRRFTVWLPIALVDAVDEAARRGESKKTIVTRALARELGLDLAE